MRDRLIESVKAHEGFRNRAYQDTVGVWTIGYGTNLQALEIDEWTAETWLVEALGEAGEALEDVDGFNACSAVRQDVLVEMAYQLGVKGCLRFEKMWEAIRAGDFIAASDEMLDSKWAKQTPDRVRQLARRMRLNEWEV